MDCRLVALDKRPGVRHVGIGETLRRALDKLVMRAAGEQANMERGNLQLCAGLKAGTEGATQAVGQIRLDTERARWREEAATETDEETERVVVDLNNLTIETAGTEEEAAEILAAAISMDIEVNREGEGEGEEEGDGTQRALVSL